MQTGNWPLQAPLRHFNRWFPTWGSSDGSKMSRRKEKQWYFHLFCGILHFASIIGQHVFCSIPVWDVFDNPSSPSITSDMIVAYQCVARVTMEASHPIISMSLTLGKILRRGSFHLWTFLAFWLPLVLPFAKSGGWQEEPEWRMPQLAKSINGQS